MKIQDIIKKFEEDYSSFKLCNQVSKPELDKLKQFIQSSLKSLLDSIENKLPGNRELGQLELLEDTCLESFKTGYNHYRQEVINIINSHK